MPASKRAGAGSESESPMIDLSSMVDVSFLLIIYFLVTSTLVPRERDLDLRLPQPGNTEPQPALPVMIRLSADGAVLWGSGASFDVVDEAGSDPRLDGLGSRLRLAKAGAGPDELPVLLAVDDASSQQRVIDVLNCFAGEGISRVGVVDLAGR